MFFSCQYRTRINALCEIYSFLCALIRSRQEVWGERRWRPCFTWSVVHLVLLSVCYWPELWISRRELRKSNSHFSQFIKRKCKKCCFLLSQNCEYLQLINLFDSRFSSASGNLIWMIQKCSFLSWLAVGVKPTKHLCLLFLDHNDDRNHPNDPDEKCTYPGGFGLIKYTQVDTHRFKRLLKVTIWQPHRPLHVSSSAALLLLDFEP